MDGFLSSNYILLIGATNRKDTLDEAILRPQSPSRATRKEILDIHRRKKPIDVSTDILADLTEGMSGTQIENILNKATLLSLPQNILPVSLFEKIRDRMLFPHHLSEPRTISHPNQKKRNPTDRTGPT